MTGSTRCSSRRRPLRQRRLPPLHSRRRRHSSRCHSNSRSSWSSQQRQARRLSLLQPTRRSQQRRSERHRCGRAACSRPFAAAAAPTHERCSFNGTGAAARAQFCSTPPCPGATHEKHAQRLRGAWHLVTPNHGGPASISAPATSILCRPCVPMPLIVCSIPSRPTLRLAPAALLLYLPQCYPTNLAAATSAPAAEHSWGVACHSPALPANAYTAIFGCAWLLCRLRCPKARLRCSPLCFRLLP